MLLLIWLKMLQEPDKRTDNDQQTIIDVIVANIRNGGEVANAMSGTYGLARQGY